MKQFLPFLAAIACCTQLFAQDCSELFFSEYVEGSYNNKAMAVYNPTNANIDLSGYKIIRWSNGNASYDPTYSVTLSGTIAPKDEIVIVLDKQDCSLGGQDTCVFQGLKDKADLFVSPNYTNNPCLYHNGDDAMSLNKNDGANGGVGTFVDIFGVIGEDPGTSWTDTAPYTESAGGAFWTKDQTCYRKASVKKGITELLSGGQWNPTAEWDTLPMNTFDHLGYHICQCGSTAIDEVTTKATQVSIFPNPATAGGKSYVVAAKIVEKIEIFSTTGQLIATTMGDGFKQMALDIPAVSAGAYMVKTSFRDATNPIYSKLLIK